MLIVTSLNKFIRFDEHIQGVLLKDILVLGKEPILLAVFRWSLWLHTTKSIEIQTHRWQEELFFFEPSEKNCSEINKINQIRQKIIHSFQIKRLKWNVFFHFHTVLGKKKYIYIHPHKPILILTSQHDNFSYQISNKGSIFQKLPLNSEGSETAKKLGSP